MGEEKQLCFRFGFTFNTCWCSAKNERMTPINHALWFLFRGPLGSSPHSLPIAPARKGLLHQKTRRFRFSSWFSHLLFLGTPQNGFRLSYRFPFKTLPCPHRTFGSSLVPSLKASLDSSCSLAPAPWPQLLGSLPNSYPGIQKALTRKAFIERAFVSMDVGMGEGGGSRVQA